MATVRNVVVDLVTRHRRFEKGFEDSTRSVRRFQRQTNKSLAAVNVSLSGTGKAVGALNSSVGTLSRGIGTGFKVAGAVGALSALAGSAAVATQQMIALTAALAPASGALLAIPGAVGLAAAAIGTLKLATIGVGDAFKAAMGTDIEHLKETLKGLSPAARRVTVELHRLRPVLLGIKNAAQEGVFGPLQGQLTKTVKVLRGPLRQGFKELGRQIGAAGVDVAKFVREARTVEAIRAIFHNTTRSIAFLRNAINPLLGGFRDLARVGSGFLTTLTPAITRAGMAFGQWLSQIARSGQATEWLTNAVNLFTQLGRIIRNVGSILSSVFRAAGETGAGLLGTIEKLTAQFAAWLKTAEGAYAIRSIFATISQIGTALGPVVMGLAQGLGAIAPALGRIAMVVGPILTRAIESLAPALAALEPGITALITGLGGAVTALAPALLPLADALSRIATAAAPILAQVVGALAPALLQLEPGITALVNGLGGLVAALAPALVPIGRALSGIAAGLAPVLPALGELVAMLAQGLAVHIQRMLPVLPRVVDAIIKLALALGQHLLRVLEAISPQLPALVVALSDLLIALIPIIPPLADFLIALTPLIPVITDVIKFLSELAYFVMPALRNSIELNAGSLKIFLDSVKWVVDQVYRAFSWLFDVLVGHSIIPDLVNGITRWFRDGARWMVDAFTGGIKRLVQAAASLPGKIARAVGNLGGLLYGAGQNVIIGLWNGIASLAGWISRSIADLVRRIIPEPVRRVLGIASPSKVFRGFGVNLGEGLVLGMQASQGMVSRAAASLAGAAVPAFAGPGMAGVPTPRGALQANSAGGDDRRELARLVAAEVAAAMRNVSVKAFIDGDEVTEKVSRRQGQTTQLRRRSG